MFCCVIKPVCSSDTWDTGVQYLKHRYLESLNFSASRVWEFILSPGIPFYVKVEGEGGSLEFFIESGRGISYSSR